MTNTNTANKAAKVTEKKAPANCRCGCGHPTVTERALFLSGHDARLAGVLGRAKVEGWTDAQVKQYESLSDRLQAKVDGVAEVATRKAAEKVAREAAKAAAKAAFDAAMAEAKA